MTFATTNCSAYNHPEIVIECDPSASFEAPHLLRWIENLIASGKSLRAGKTIQIGCVTATIRLTEDNQLTLHEPDFQGMPVVFAHSLTQTLLTLRKQKSVLASFGLDQQGQFSSLFLTALRCKGFDAAKGMILCRTEPTRIDSGWFFGCLDESHDHSDPANLVKESLYAISCRHLQLLDFLAMPPGTMIVLDEAGEVVSARDGEERELEIIPESYLALKRSEIPNPNLEIQNNQEMGQKEIV